ncbi:MAG: hypothetical protein K0B14_04500 [Anaerolineaceae bacterium]|nr:hypothetical protein [Anaerolineaceae bacterium]
MKTKIIFLVVMAILLTSCQSTMTPTPEIKEVTRIVEQTSIVTKIVEETVLAPEIVEDTPTKHPNSTGEFELKPEYFDATLALVKYFNYLDTKDCVAYYDAQSMHNQRASLEDTITYCEKIIGNVEVVSVYPLNYQYYLEGRRLGNEPEGHIYLTSFVLMEEIALGEMVERSIIFEVDMIWENEEWKVNSTNTSPLF